MKRLICTAIVAMSAASTASAGYIGDRATWDKLPNGAKIVYVMGVYDASNILFDDDSKETVALKKARVRCLAEERLNNSQLAALVDAAYAAAAAKASQPPSTVLIGQVSARCERQINEERAKLGLASTR